MANGQWLTTAEAGARLGIGRIMAWRWVKEGRFQAEGIRVTRIGRWHRIQADDLDAYLRRKIQEQEAAARSGRTGPPL